MVKRGGLSRREARSMTNEERRVWIEQMKEEAEEEKRRSEEAKAGQGGLSKPPRGPR